MPPDKPPTSKKVKDVIDKLGDGSDISKQLWKDISEAVTKAADEAGVHNLSDSERAELYFYFGSKIQSCSVI